MALVTVLAARQMNNLYRRTAAAFGLLVIVSTTILMALGISLLDQHFKRYAIEKREAQSAAVANTLTDLYQIGNRWDERITSAIGYRSLDAGLILTVYDAMGQPVWDARTAAPERVKSMMDAMNNVMSSRYYDWTRQDEESELLLTADGETIGKVRYLFCGPFFFDLEEMAVINNLTRAFFILTGVVGTLTVLGVLGCAYWALVPWRRAKTQAIREAQQALGEPATKVRYPQSDDPSVISQYIGQLSTTILRHQDFKKRLVTDFSHEIRTPLAALSSHLEALVDGIWQPTRDRLLACHEEVERLGRLVSELHRLARYDANEDVLQRSTFDLTELVQRIVTRHEADITSKELQVTVRGKATEMNADKDKMTQVVVNLLTNSIKYTHEGGKVDIAISDDHDSVGLSIWDNGCGIATVDLSRIFERFYRADLSRSRDTGGSGLGLSIVKSIVEAHGGRISVSSELGVGTEFIVVMPKHPAIAR